MQTYPPGTRIGQYEIASRSMIGGMGVVYFALDHGNDGRPVALKTFRPELLPNREARDRFLREGTAWIELGSHPHIVRCYKVEYIDPTAFLVLELIAKEQNMPDASLRSWLIPGRPLPLEQALLFALQIARGMQYATEKIPGFVHRDLKPENILVGADKLAGTNINRLRVTDFGLVKTIAGGDIPAIEGNTEGLKLNQVQFTRGVGTPLYMAPEQWMGEPVGVFTDVYAFGCILYEMISGQQAVKGRTITDLRKAHCTGNLHPIPQSIPNELQVLLRKSLILEGIQRFANWADVANGLAHIYSLQSKNTVRIASEFTEYSSDSKVQDGRSYNMIGYAYSDIGKRVLSIRFFEMALAIGKREQSPELECEALEGLGFVSMSLGNAEEAIRHYEQALTILRDYRDQHGQAVGLSNLGGTYIKLGDMKKAKGCYEKALAILHEFEDQRLLADVLTNLGTTNQKLGDLRQAMNYYEQALEIARKVDNKRGEGIILGRMGNAYAALGELTHAIRLFERHLAIAHEIGDRDGEGTALGNLGVAYTELNDVRRAITCHERALEIACQIGDKLAEGRALANLGIAYAMLSKTAQAIDYLEQGLVIAKEIGDKGGEGNILLNLGNVYVRLKDDQIAMRYYEQALAIKRELGDLDEAARTLLNMALIYAMHRQDIVALTLAQEAERIWTQIGSAKSGEAQDVVVKLRHLSGKK